MYLLSDSSEENVVALRGRLDALGESVLVVGGVDLWNVHVHLDDVGAAIQAGIEAGRPHRIVVTHFGDQQRAKAAQLGHSTHGPVAVVACAAGQGLAEVFRRAGAVAVFNGPGRRASAGQLLDAIRSAGSRSVIVLPNERGTLLAAQAAASAAGDAGLEVQVVPSRSAAQGISALAVFEPSASARNNLVAMSGAAAATRNGAVMLAVKESMTTAGWSQPGDVLGLVDGEVVVVGRPSAAGAGTGVGGVVVVLGARLPAHRRCEVQARACGGGHRVVPHGYLLRSPRRLCRRRALPRANHGGVTPTLGIRNLVCAGSVATTGAAHQELAMYPPAWGAVC